MGFTFEWNGEQKSIHSLLPEVCATAIGVAITTWSEFEQSVDLYHQILRWNPDVAKMGKIPFSFPDRAERISQAISIAFPQCSNLRSYVDELMTEAKMLCKLRNAITHSGWAAADEVIHAFERMDGTGKWYITTPEQILEAAHRMQGCHHRLIHVLLLPNLQSPSKDIPPGEIQVVKDHYDKYRPDANAQPAVPRPRFPLVE